MTELDSTTPNKTPNNGEPMTYEFEENTAITATPIAATTITLDQWLKKRDAWLESTDELVRLWFENKLGTRADLGRHLGMAKSTITYHCNKLIEAGCKAIPSSKGQGKRRDLEVVEVIDVSSNVELPAAEPTEVELKLARAKELVAKHEARKRARQRDLIEAERYEAELNSENAKLIRMSDRLAELEAENAELKAQAAKSEDEAPVNLDAVADGIRGFTLDALIEYVEQYPKRDGVLADDPLHHDLCRLANSIADRL